MGETPPPDFSEEQRRKWNEAQRKRKIASTPPLIIKQVTGDKPAQINQIDTRPVREQ